jgi:hypothetical protein
MSGSVLLAVAIIAIIFLIENYKVISGSSIRVFFYIIFNLFYIILISINKISITKGWSFHIPSILYTAIALIAIIVILFDLKSILCYTLVSIAWTDEDEEISEEDRERIDKEIEEHNNNSKMGIILSLVSVFVFIDAASHISRLIWVYFK